MKKLRDISSEKGKPLRLEVTFSGTPKVNVTWKKDGKLIWASYEYTVITTDTSCILEILNSDRMEAAGTYSCEVDNGVGSDKCEAHISILGKNKGTLACYVFSSFASTLIPIYYRSLIISFFKIFICTLTLVLKPSSSSFI